MINNSTVSVIIATLQGLFFVIGLQLLANKVERLVLGKGLALALRVALRVVLLIVGVTIILALATGHNFDVIARIKDLLP